MAYKLKNKSGMSDGIIDQIKSVVMEKVMESFEGEAFKTGDTEGNSLMFMLTDGDLLSKLGGFFK